MKKLISLTFFIFFVLIIQNSFSQIQNLWGITAEGVEDGMNITDLKNSLSALPYMTTTRMVLYPNDGEGEDPYTPNPEKYDDATEDIKTVSNFMAEIMDSEAWAWEPWGNDPCNTGNNWTFGTTEVLNHLDAFLANTKFQNSVDIWEVGNELNAPWVYQGNTYNVMYTIDQALKHVKNAPYKMNSKKTAITLYYYPSEECVDDCEGSNPEPNSNYLMSTWAQNFVNNFPDVVNNVDYVFVSYYWDAHNWEPCKPDTITYWDWDLIFCSLQLTFPHSIIGFGEVGWGDEEPSPEEKAYIANTYYRYHPGGFLCGRGYKFTRACFYWNYMTDCLPDFTSSLVWQEINSAMWDFGLYGRPEMQLTGKTDNIISKNTYNLFQNYPNPFNPVTNIKYTLHRSGNVKLAIYDMLGREIKTLVNEYKQSGVYSVSFDAANLASGVYLYELAILDGNNGIIFTDVKKMLVVK